MLTTEKLEEFFQDQWNIIVDLNISIRNMSRLANDKYDRENDIKKHGFFRHHWHQLKFISVIQVSKLFSQKKNDKRSFNKLCDLLDSTPFDDSLVLNFEQNKSKSSDIAHARNDISTLIDKARVAIKENNGLIDKFVNARDKVFAHKDPNQIASIPTLNEIRHMTDIANDIHNQFTFNIFFRTTMFDHSDSWDIDYVLWYISEYRKKDLKELERKKKGLI